jgi:hypothetical protein
MTSMVLSESTQRAINVAVTAGPGANNQNSLAAYNAIAADIRSQDGFRGSDGGTTFFGSPNIHF